MTGARVLVAGIGNVFLGDDGFGVEVVRRLDPADLPEDVDVADYGIRGVHLAYELLDGRYSTLVMVDAIPLDDPPGSLAVMEVPLADGHTDEGRADALAVPTIDGHGMSPLSVIELMRTLGGSVERVLVVGCRPAVIEERMELSEAVQAAVDPAVQLVRNVVTRLPREVRTPEEKPVEVA